jgi:polar amino acid transport system substrate-binding protein
VVAASISALALAFSACGSNSLTQPTSAAPVETASSSVNQSLAAKVPDKIKTAGVIQIGVDATYAPNEYMNGNQVVGLDVDLFDAVAADLGLKTKWNPANFDSILIGVTAGKYDVGVSSFTINAEREKQVTFVQYANVGEQWATPTGNPKGVDPKNPCGQTVAVQTKTVEDDELTAMNKAQCASKPINLLHYDGQDAVNNALVSGKAAAMLADYPITQYAIKMTGGKLEALGDQYGQAPYGYAMTKENQSLAEAISGALSDLKANGTYDKILADYGVTAAGVSSFDINPKV